MDTALHTAGLTSQIHQGTGVRLVHRFGRSLRGLIARSIGITAGRRRNPAPHTRTTPEPCDKAAPKRPRTARRPRTASPMTSLQPARTGWFARWFGRRRTPPAPQSRPQPRRDEEVRFTPERFPGIRPEVCQILNTPVGECDPQLLRLVLFVLANHIAKNRPELGMTDPQALFAKMWGRVAFAIEQPKPEQSPATPPELPGATPEAEPEPAQATSPSKAPASPEDAATDSVTAATATPNAVCRSGPAPQQRHALILRGTRRDRRVRAPACYHHSHLHRGAPPKVRRSPPKRLLYYASCAGPP